MTCERIPFIVIGLT